MHKIAALFLATSILFSSGYAVAADAMKKEPMMADGKKMDTMGKPDMKQDDMKKDAMQKPDMKKDPMKKDAMMPKDGMGKADMKK
jgi:pentapeptide MXKDX repeat protein